VDMLAANGSPVTGLIQQMIDYYLDTFGQLRGITAFAMHDPLCLAAVLRPELITWKSAYVDVELAGTLTLGETVAYFEQLEDIDPSLEHLHRSNVQASVGVDVEKFITFYLETVKQVFS
jgi:inosine-uridine nucleoside N-ribohydrolase